MNAPVSASIRNAEARGLRGISIGWPTVLGLALILSACGARPDVDLPMAIQPSATPASIEINPTPEPPLPPTLIICLRNEPETLYLYGETNRETDVVLQALYDGPYDILGHQIRPVILEKLPSLEDGDARFESVALTEGSRYLNPETLLPDLLETHKPYLPSGCTSPDCVRTYLSGEVFMDRMIVEFRLRDGIRWSDGELVRASDSVFSFLVDADKKTPSLKFLVDRTESYQEIDALTVRWTGIPGFMDDEYQSNFWSPLPQHILGEYEAGDLLVLEDAGQNPIGWGPYVVDSWQPGIQIVLRKNEMYYRAEEGLPAFDFLIFRFIGGADQDSALQQVLSGECDVLDESLIDHDQLPRLVEQVESNRLAMSWASGPRVERLEFNLSPSQYAIVQLFGDVRTRQAIGACIDRERIVQQALAGLSQVADSYLPPTHPLYYQAPLTISPDLQTAALQLDRAGWVVDGSGEGWRVSRGAIGVRDGTPLAVTYLTTPGTLHETIGLMLQEDLARCGIQLELEVREAQELFASWPEGDVFSRRFEMVDWAWPAFIGPPCEMFLGSEIASDANSFGINASGFRDREYDQACRRLLLGLPGTEDYLQAAQRTQELLAANLPAIPMFIHPRIVIHREDLCGVEVDATAPSVFWNLESYYLGDTCVE